MGVKIIAISTDDARNSSKVPAFVNGRAWDFEVYLDPNGDFKRAMNVNNVPHVFVIRDRGTPRSHADRQDKRMCFECNPTKSCKVSTL